MHIELRSISRRVGSQTIVDGLSLAIPSRQLLTLLGPSGCGKTSLLRLIAGLDPLDSGQILFDGRDTASWSLKERRVGFVFQHYALFPHMTLRDNISFGWRVLGRAERPSAAEISQRGQRLLALVHLEGLGDRYPHQLSGGQRQRVALARALAIEPRILLLDEPFGALDTQVRRDLRRSLRAVQQELGITCVLVTHDQEEALEISDHVVLLNQGRIEQEGAPDQLFEQAHTAFALNFLGSPQRLTHDRAAPDCPSSASPRAPSTYVRSHEISIERGSHGPRAVIRRISLRGAFARLHLAPLDGPRELLAEISIEHLQRLSLKAGEEIVWRPQRTYQIDGN